uniref:Uncharacterized protein n=1 Tax=Cannabis sativa TaxID=3483 RepID=A0A803PQX5_CANSA
MFVGDGTSIEAFRDSWLPRPRTIRPITPKPGVDWLVKEFIAVNGCWNLPALHHVFLPMDVEVILGISLPSDAYGDRWCWHYDSNECYTVRSGYALALELFAMVAMVWWWIWYDRNSVLCGNTQSSLDVIADLAAVALEEFLTPSSSGVQQQLGERGRVVRRETVEHGCYESGSRVVAGVGSKWVPPKPKVLVLSTDAAVTPWRCFTGFEG